MKRILFNVILSCCLVFLLSGCGHEHVWTEATCTTPQTCQKCNETVGEPIDHTPTEADYQNPSVCSVCGEKLADSLTPDFELYNLTCDVEVNQPFDYTCISNGERNDCSVTITSYERNVASPSGFETPDGYEWLSCKCKVILKNGAKTFGKTYEDYYTVSLHDESFVFSNDYTSATFSVLWNGTKYEDCKMVSEVNVPDAGIFDLDIKMCVPIGYDGCVINFHTVEQWPAGAKIYELENATFHMFRMK